jgi:hypothetical protein
VPARPAADDLILGLRLEGQRLAWPRYRVELLPEHGHLLLQRADRVSVLLTLELKLIDAEVRLQLVLLELLESARQASL